MGYARGLSNLGRRIQETLIGPEKAAWSRLVRSGAVVKGVGTYGFPQVQQFIHENVRLVVGNYCSLANSATFLLGGEHPLDRATSFPLRIRFGLAKAGLDGFPKQSADTELGSDVWVGAQTLVLSGRSVGHGAVVAGGAVVARDVPPYAIVGGNPARIIGYRHTEAQRAALLEIAWWDWSEERIRMSVPVLAGPDVDAFIAFANAQ